MVLGYFAVCCLLLCVSFCVLFGEVVSVIEGEALEILKKKLLYRTLEHIAFVQRCGQRMERERPGRLTPIHSIIVTYQSWSTLTLGTR